MNCDPNALAQAASCFQCGLSDDVLSAIKTSLLCAWANAAPDMMIPDLPAGLTTDLILRNESLSFDASSPGSSITEWRDLSGFSHHWNLNVTNITVDFTRMVGTHPSLRFDGATSYAQQPYFFDAAGYTGLTMMLVFKQDVDPPVAFATEANVACFNHPINFPHHHPFSDGNFYEGFARTDRPNMGNPAMSLSAAFRIYTVVANSAGTSYNCWLRGGGVTENFFTSGAFTFQQQGQEVTNPAVTNPGIGGHNYSLGRGWRYDVVQSYFLAGNIAAVFVWKQALSNADRTAMWGYLESTYSL